MANRLAQESSPYLLQHRDNPVDWYPWGAEALRRARELDRPLLVSIGYSACHWCHVMAHESFEDPETAAVMNERFVCVKVDREERPDVDALCMEACQAMTGRGGWPLNAFLTPELVPFYAGTYFPRQPAHGMPSWRMVLDAVAEAWEQRREQIRQRAPEILRSLQASVRLAPSEEPIVEERLQEAQAALRGAYDARHGGFGGAPKFPPASVIEFLLARGEREMSLHTLEAMAHGGIYDQLGGGFARYSVDAAWRVPHFEKMLYDNALLARAYLHGWQVSGRPLFERVCRETLDWALREMRGAEGGFYAALDADSEGQEGRYYVWTAAELRERLGPALAAEAIRHFEVSERGNFEDGRNVLQARDPEPAAREEIRRRLLEARAQRVRPGTDDKRLTAWNALMISALAEAGTVLEEPRYTEAARGCAGFLLEELRDREGRLLRTWKDGRARIGGYLEDYAFLLEALITLYESTFEVRWYRAAVELADELIERFADPQRGGFFTTAEAGGAGRGRDAGEPVADASGLRRLAGAGGQEPALPVRRKDLEDSPVPSGNSAAAYGLLRLALLSGRARYEQHALGVLRLLFPLAVRHPLAFGHLLCAADFHISPVREVAIVGPEPQRRPLLRVVRQRLRPHLVLAAGGGEEGEAVPLLAGRRAIGGRAAAYVCERFVCGPPVTTPEELAAAL